VIGVDNVEVPLSDGGVLILFDWEIKNEENREFTGFCWRLVNSTSGVNIKLKFGSQCKSIEGTSGCISVDGQNAISYIDFCPEGVHRPCSSTDELPSECDVFLQCPDDEVICNVTFADFGDPTCPYQQPCNRNPGCSFNVLPFVNEVCLGQQSCRLPVSGEFLEIPSGDNPCDGRKGTPKVDESLAVQAICCQNISVPPCSIAAQPVIEPCVVNDVSRASSSPEILTIDEVEDTGRGDAVANDTLLLLGIAAAVAFFVFGTAIFMYRRASSLQSSAPPAPRGMLSFDPSSGWTVTYNQSLLKGKGNPAYLNELHHDNADVS